MSLQPSFLGLGAEWHRGGVLIGRVLAVGAVLVVAARTGEDPDDQVSWATLERTARPVSRWSRTASWRRRVLGVRLRRRVRGRRSPDGLTSAVLEGFGAHVTEHAYGKEDREAVYRVIAERRDMRDFAGGTVDDDVLARLLSAAHQAPSVGLMQPWRIVRRDRSAAAPGTPTITSRSSAGTPPRRWGSALMSSCGSKAQGILDCAEVLVVAGGDDRERHVFGRRTMPHMDLASVSCAIQNLWLAARAEGLGMGWVSLFVPADVAGLDQAPEGAEPVAILVLAPVEAFYERPYARAGELDFGTSPGRAARRELLAHLTVRPRCLSRGMEPDEPGWQLLDDFFAKEASGRAEATVRRDAAYVTGSRGSSTPQREPMARRRAGDVALCGA